MPLCRPWPPSAAPSHWWRRAETSHRKPWKTKPLPNSAFLTCLWRYWKMSKDLRDSHFEKPVFNQFEPIVSSWGFSTVFNLDRCWSMLIDVDNVCGARLIPPRSLSTAPVRRERLHRNRRKTDEKIEAKNGKHHGKRVILAVLGWILLRLSRFFDFEACWCLYISLYRCLYCDSLWFFVILCDMSLRCRRGAPDLWRQRLHSIRPGREGVVTIGSLDVRCVRWTIDEL